jgi:hypothetical protein
MPSTPANAPDDFIASTAPICATDTDIAAPNVITIVSSKNSSNTDFVTTDTTMMVATMIPKTNISSDSTTGNSSSTHGNTRSNQNDKSPCDGHHSNNHNEKECADDTAVAANQAGEQEQYKEEDHADDLDHTLCVPPHQQQLQQHITSKTRKIMIEDSQKNACSATSICKGTFTTKTAAPPFFVTAPAAAAPPLCSTSNITTTSGAGNQQQELGGKNKTKGSHCPSSWRSNSIKSSSISANNDEDYYPETTPHLTPIYSTIVGANVLVNARQEDEEDDYRKQSERKRCREKKRRQSISTAIEKLTSILVKVDPSNLIYHNSQVYFGDTTFAGSSKRARYGGASSIKNLPLNRTEIINHTVYLVEKLAVENEEMKLKMLQLQYILTSNDTKIASMTSSRGVGNLLSSEASFSSQRLSDESMTNLLRSQQDHINNVSLLTTHKCIFNYLCCSSFLDRRTNYTK